MLAIVFAKSAEEQRRKPAPDKWNNLEVIEHLTISENGIASFFDKYPPAQSKYRTTLKGRLRAWLLKISLKSPLKFKVPLPALEPKGNLTPEELTARWDKARERLKAHLDAIPADMKDFTMFKHPFAGPLTMAQTLTFMGEHIRKHIKQL